MNFNNNSQMRIPCAAEELRLPRQMAAAARGGRELAWKKDHCRIYVDDCDCPTSSVDGASGAALQRLSSDDDDDNMRKIGP